MFKRNVSGWGLSAATLMAGGLAWGQEPPPGMIDLQAQQIVQNQASIEARGDVVLQRDETTLSGGCLQFDRGSGWIEAGQDLLLQRPDITVAAPKGHYHPKDRVGSVEQASGTIHGADDIYFRVDLLELGPQSWTLTNPWITTCDPGRSDWALRASMADIDPDHSMTLQDLRFEVEGIPVAYLPWLRTTLKPRDSGLLFPLFSSGNRRGSEIAWPLYWATTPWMDITYTPHWMSRLGWGHEGEIRLAQPGDGMLLLRGFLLNDGGQSRSLKGWEQRIVGPGWHWETRGELFSDVGMASDFVLPLQRDATGRYAMQTATLAGAGEWGNGGLFMNHRQDLIGSSQGQVVSDAGWMWSMSGIVDALSFQWDVEMTQKRWYAPQGVDLSRWQATPSVGQSINVDGFAAQWQARSWLAHYRERDGRVVQRVVPAVSADVSTGFEKVFHGSTQQGWNRVRHRLQPHMQAVWIPYEDQSTLPAQEAGPWQLGWSNLWALNRYAGEDYINGARRITLGLSQNLDGGYGPVDERRTRRFGALEVLRSFEADPSRVLSDNTGVVDHWSPWFVRVMLGSDEGWSAGGDIRWDNSGVLDRHRMLQWRSQLAQTRLSESWIPNVQHSWMWSGAVTSDMGTFKARYEWDPEGAGFLISGISWRGDFGCWAVGLVAERLRLLDGGLDVRFGFGLTLLGLGGGGKLPELSDL